MKIIFSKKKLIKALDNEENLGFVPTMGALHDGHKYLIKKSMQNNKKTIVSIFVNKQQFNKKDDYSSYPRVFKKDKKILKELNVDYVFVPNEKDIYPEKIIKKIKINSFKKKLCGKFRPNHFEAVVDVVSRFIKIINPKRIYLGKKDMQQLMLIYDYLKKKKFNTEVIACKTVRQKNGMAYSSRNLHLNYKNQAVGSKIYKLLLKQKRKIILKKISLKHIKSKITKFGVEKIDYLNILDLNKLIKPHKKKINKKIFIAYYINSVRLIDNI